jgi:aminoglycoside phosphotransferase (APT) family kinase protein
MGEPKPGAGPPLKGTPAAEHDIDADLVRELLASQHPDLADQAIRAVDAGWDNAMFRLGEGLAVRLPRRAAAAQLVLNEQRWLPLLAARLPLPIPAPLRIGAPGCGYPWSWSIVPWLDGESADLAPPAPSQAGPLAGFLRALHQPAPAEAPANPVRGIPLQARAAVVEERLGRLSRLTGMVGPQVLAIWRGALDAPPERAPTWLHGDLHARNVLVRDGVISGVIDWGDITRGDRAADLASVWMLLEPAQARSAAISAYGDADPDLWRRAKGWAVLLAAALLDTGLVDHPRHAAMGEAAFRRLLADG